jgi:hypothetical protein
MRAPRIARDLKSGLLAITVLLLSGITAATQEPARILGLIIPEQVGGLAHGPPTDYETKSPGLGYSLRFLRTGWAVDVYIYDFQLKSIPADIESPVVRDQLVRAKGDIFEIGRRGSYANVEERGEFRVGSAKTGFVCAIFSYLRGEKKEQDVDSYLCLTSWDNKFIKIRMTALKGQMTRNDVTNFVEAWMPLLSRSL